MSKFLFVLLATTVSLSAFERIEEFGEKSDSDSSRKNSMILDNKEQQFDLEGEQQLDLKSVEHLNSELENLSITKTVPLTKAQKQALRQKEKIERQIQKQQQKTKLLLERKEKKLNAKSQSNNKPLSSEKNLIEKSQLESPLEKEEVIQKKN